MEDILAYQISPFIDLPKTNQYYYCIAYAKDNGITQWYITDSSGKATCENSQQYMSSPFCAANTITRIEAAAILLRRAQLWDDTLNSGNFDKSLSIVDTTPYWYGYAKKWIEIGIIQQKSDKKIGQDEKISRGEFAIMAARILRYTQCQIDTIDNTIEAAIGIRDTNQKLIQKSNFNPWEIFSLVPITTSGNWNYNWIARNPNTWEIIELSGSLLPSSKLSEWVWIINLQVIDPVTNTVVSQPFSTIRIWTKDTYNGDIAIRDKNGNISNENIFQKSDNITLVSTHTGWPWDQTWQAIDKKSGNIVTGTWKEFSGSKLWEWNWTVTLITKDQNSGKVVDTDIREIQIISTNNSIGNDNNLTISLHANPLISNLWDRVDFFSSTNSTGSVIYKWDFWDGTIATWSGSNNHIYLEWWVYTVILTIIDPKTWNTSQSSVVIKVTGERDTDWDKIPDSIDQCPLVYTVGNNGCPTITTYNNQNPTIPINTGNIWATMETAIQAAIGIRNGSGDIISNNNFPKWEVFSLIPITGAGNWDYSWRATNPITGQIVAWSGFILPGSIFGTGDWKVNLDVINPVTGQTVASPSITIRIRDNNTPPNTWSNPCVSIIATPMNTTVNSLVTTTPTVCPSSNPLIYTWNYGDGTTSNGTGTTNHAYTTPGFYPITLTVTDPKTWKVSESTVIVKIVENNTTIASTNGSFIGGNICLENHRKTQWLLIGKANCTQCPCKNTISINAPLRSCDIVFPTILSPSLDMIYARGWFYLIP
jgi:PKD repeat protein